MQDKHCPVCRAQGFYLRLPEDQYEIYEFEITDGNLAFKPDSNKPDDLELSAETEIYCGRFCRGLPQQADFQALEVLAVAIAAKHQEQQLP